MTRAQRAFEAWATAQWGHMASVPHNAWLGFEAAFNQQQAKIDRLMLEFCPQEMSDEQHAEWEASQRRAKQ